MSTPESIDGGQLVGSLESQLAELRARKFRALSALYGMRFESFERSIETLLEACPGVMQCPVISGEVHELGLEALEWARSNPDLAQFSEEHIRLFGGEDLARQMPIVPPCASMYMTEEYDGNPADVAAIYSGAGFYPDPGSGRSPSHVCNELDFMAHCLESDNHDVSTVAYAFMMSHLFGWGVVFSAATYARSTNPVIRFAGMMLEHLLFCELEHARDHSRHDGMLAEIRSVS